MLQADPLRDREIKFFINGHFYKATFKMSKGWTILDNWGVTVSEKKSPEIWKEFRNKHQPSDTKSELFPQ